MTFHSTRDAHPSRATSAIILRPSTPTAYGHLRSWLAGKHGLSSLAVLGDDRSGRLAQAIAPWPLREVGWRDFASAVNRFGTAIVLCVMDDEATAGATVYRLVGELLFSDRVVLLGPQASGEMPGGRGLARPRRLRELAALAGVAFVALSTTTVALTVILLQDAWERRWRP